MLRVKPICVRPGVYRIPNNNGGPKMPYIIDHSLCCRIAGARRANELAYPVRQSVIAGYIVEEYASMTEALPVMELYAHRRLVCELVGRFLCVSTCPMYV
jgi:hypothetical protein